MDYIIDIKCLHYKRHCNVMKVLPLLFFSQKILLGALFFLFSVSKVVRSDWVIRPKSLSKDVVSGLATRLKALGSSFQPGLLILGLAGPPNIFNFIFLPF